MFYLKLVILEYGRIMEILKGVTYFDKQKLGKQYAYLNKDIVCDVAIIGGGIDGAIVNYFLITNQ